MTTAITTAPTSTRRGSTLRLHFTAQDILRTTVLTTPDPAGAGIDGAVERILATPRDQLRTDLDPVRLRRELSPFGKAIGAAERDAMRQLAGALHRYYDRMVRPQWDIMSQVVRADAAVRTRHLMSGGVDKMLANLGPMFHWEWPVLEAPYVRGKEIRLAEQTGVSLATASQQVALLRQARLVRSRRHGQSVVHTLDEHGRRLLAQE